MPTITAGGQTFDYSLQGSGPDMAILLHAAASSPRALKGLAASLEQRVGSVALPPLVADGRSLIGEGQDAFAKAVSLVRALLAQQPQGRRVLFGHSMGGLIALLSLMEPQPCDLAILYEPVVFAALNRDDPADRKALDWDTDIIAALRDHCASGDSEAGVARFIEGYGEGAWMDLPEPARNHLVAQDHIILAEALAANGLRIDLDRIRAITTPILLLQGSRSPDVTHRISARLVTLLPRAKLLTLEGLGHMGPAMASGAIAEAIEPFLTGRLPL